MSETYVPEEDKKSAVSRRFVDKLKKGMLKGTTSYSGPTGEVLATPFDLDIEGAMVQAREDTEKYLEGGPYFSATSEEWGERIGAYYDKEDQKKQEAKTKRDEFVNLEQLGKTRINNITVSIPPEQISIQTSIKNVSVGTLRSATTQKVRTGHGYVQVAFPLVFTTKADVNEQLVPLIHMFRKTPFCRVENAFLRKVLMPHVDDANRALMFTLQSINVHSVENLPTTLRCNLQLLWFNYLPYIRDIKYRKHFSLNDMSRESGKPETYQSPPGPYNKPIHESIPDFYDHTYIENNIREALRSMQRIGLTREDKVRLYDQVQIAVDDPGDSKAWLKFVKGFSNNLLKSSSDFGPDLLPENAFQMAYKRFRKGAPPQGEAGWIEEERGPDIWSKVITFTANSQFNPIHVNVAFTNRIAQLPLLDQRLPTHQFLGSMDRELVVTFFVTEAGQTTLKVFGQYIEDFEKQVLKFRSFTKDQWMEVKNPVAKAAGLNKVVPERMDIQTVPGSPGASQVRVFFSEYSPFAFRHPRKVGGGVNAILQALCEAIFNKISGGDPTTVLDVTNEKYEQIRSRLEREAQGWLPTDADPFPAFELTPQQKIDIANQAQKVYEEQYLNENSLIPDGLALMHGIELYRVNTPKEHLVLKNVPRNSRGQITENVRLWQAAADIVEVTRNHEEGFSYADDDDVFGLKSLAGMSLIYRGQKTNLENIQEDAGKLKEDLYNTLYTWLVRDDGLSREFPHLFEELSEINRDKNACYQDLDLPAHPATNEIVDTEPDFYVYNPFLLQGADDYATDDMSKTLRDAGRLIREDVMTAPDVDTGKVQEFISTSYQNVGKTQAINVANLPRGKRDSTLYQNLQDTEMVPLDQLVDAKVTPESIANSALESIRKRNKLGLRKAFPTFRLYFIKEGRDQITYQGFEEVWGGFAVKEIRFVASRKIPADMCVISMANLDGFLETQTLTDLREEELQLEGDEVRLTRDQQNMIQYQKNYELINHWVEHFNTMRNTSLQAYYVSKLMDWEKKKPTPGGYGPLGTTPTHSQEADGKEVSPAELRKLPPNTSVRISVDVMSTYALDFGGYKDSFFYNEVVMSLYRYPQYRTEIYQAVDTTTQDNILSDDWYKAVQVKEVRDFVEFLRPSEAAVNESRRATLDARIAEKTRKFYQQRNKVEKLEESKGQLEAQKDGIPTTGQPGDPGVVISKPDRLTLEKHRKETKEQLKAASTKIEQERRLLNYMKKEIAELKTERQQYVTAKIATEGILFSEGTDIVLKLGYSNDPEKLETVFVGHVTEAQPGPGEVTIVAQTFATELVQEVKGLDEDMTADRREHLYGITQWILTMPEVKHFGRWQWRKESWEEETERRGTFWRRFSFNNNPSDDNIYIVGAYNNPDAGPGEYSPYFEYFTLNNRTLWQGLMDAVSIFPGYVMGVRPYSEGTRKGTWWRNTLFFGLPDMTYLTKTPDAVTWERYQERQTRLKRENRLLTYDVGAMGMGEIPLYESGDTVAQNEAALYRDWEAMQGERREPFRRYHTITSYSDIIDNGLITTKRGVYNGITLRGRKFAGTGAAEGDILRKKLAGMDESNINWLYVDNENARGANRGERFARSLLMTQLRDIYTGEITILGNPEIRPYDIVYLQDNYNEMFGPVEVEQVVHTFSEDTGFITQIVPDLVVSVADQMKTSILGPVGVYAYRFMLNLAGIDWKTAWRDRPSWEAFRVGAIYAGSHLLIASLMVAYPLFFLPMLIPVYFLNNFLSEHERIRIQPVFHKGKPFVTGIEGFQNPDTLNPLMNAINLMMKSVSGKYDATSRFLSNLFDPYKVEATLEYGYHNLINAP